MATTQVLSQIPAIPLASNGSPGFTVPQALDELRKRVNDQWALIVKDLNVLFAASGPGGGGTGTDIAPTNAPAPTGLTLVANTDGSMDATLTWNYTQGTYAADIFILSWKEGSAALLAPTASDTAIAIPATARAFTFQGWDPNSNYRFGISAARKGINDGTYVAGSIVSPTASPDWADVGLVGNYTANVGGSAAAVVVANASAGQTAFTDTTSFRTAGAPTANPTPSGLTVNLNTDGSVDYTLDFSYSQGALNADGFFAFVKVGDGVPVFTDPHFALLVPNSTSFTNRITLKGYPSDRLVSFGVAAYRINAVNAVEVGPIISSTSAPDWQGISSGSPNYTGTVWNLEQHNFLVRSVGGYATGVEAIQKDGQDLIWVGRDKEFIGASGAVRAAYGLGYNLSILNLTTKQVVYQHCYDTFDYSTVATPADTLSGAATGGGTAIFGAAGKFGRGLVATATGGQTAFFISGAASTTYAGLRWVELWFNHAGNPATQGTIFGLGQNGSGAGGYNVPVLRLRTDGKVEALAYDGSTFVVVTSSAPAVTDGAFHHVAAAIHNGDLWLWVDGQFNVTAHGALTSFSMSAPGAGLYLQLGFTTNGAQVLGTAYYDEFIVSTNSGFRVSGAAFTPPTKEVSDYVDGLTGTHAIFHLEEPWASAVNARTPSSALVNILDGYTKLQGAVPSTRYLFIIQTGTDGAVNRLVGGLPDALANIGGRKALFTANSFQLFSAYILIGGPGTAEGNGYEAYAGQVGSDVDARVELSFQTQGENIIAGSGGGWDPVNTPGPPTNSPTAVSASIVSASTGDDIITIGWSYTQPALSGDNKLADGFVVFVKSGDNPTPSVGATASYQVAVDSRSFTMQSPYLQSWSFAVAAFRRTTSGIEVGPVITSGAGPDWQGIGGASQVTNSGLGTNSVASAQLQNSSVSDSKIISIGSTKITGLLTVNPAGAGVTGIYLTGSGRLRIDSINNVSPGGIDFEDPAGNVKAQILGQTATLIIRPGTHNNGIGLRLGDATTSWTELSGQAVNAIRWTAPVIELNAGIGQINGFGNLTLSGFYGGGNPTSITPVGLGTYTAVAFLKWYIGGVWTYSIPLI